MLDAEDGNSAMAEAPAIVAPDAPPDAEERRQKLLQQAEELKKKQEDFLQTEFSAVISDVDTSSYKFIRVQE